MEDSIEVELTASKEKLSPEGHLTVDVFEDDGDLVVQATIAGIKKENLDVSVTKDLVTIKGRRHAEHKVKESDYYHRELYWGAFSRAIYLPFEVDADNAQASLKAGLLTIRLPKLEKDKAKKLRVLI